MKCGDVKRELALRLGNDSDNPGIWDEIRRHVSACAECRGKYHRLKETLSLMEHADPTPTYEVRGSLWPEIEKRLDAPRKPRGDGIGRSWLPMMSVAIACLLFVSVWIGGEAQKPPGHVLEKQVLPFSWPGDTQALRPSVEAREAEKRAERTRLEVETDL